MGDKQKFLQLQHTPSNETPVGLKCGPSIVLQVPCSELKYLHNEIYDGR